MTVRSNSDASAAAEQSFEPPISSPVEPNRRGERSARAAVARSRWSRDTVGAGLLAVGATGLVALALTSALSSQTLTRAVVPAEQLAPPSTSDAVALGASPSAASSTHARATANVTSAAPSVAASATGSRAAATSLAASASEPAADTSAIAEGASGSSDQVEQTSAQSSGTPTPVAQPPAALAEPVEGFARITSGRDGRFTFGNRVWGVHVDNGGRPDVVTRVERSTSGEDTARFVLGGADAPADINSVQRVEFEGHQFLEYGQTYQWRTQMRFGGAIPEKYPWPGPGGFDTGWMVIMQAHQTIDPGEFSGVPPFAVTVRYDRQIEVMTRSDPNAYSWAGSAVGVSRAVFPMEPNGFGQWHDMIMTMRFQRGGENGYLRFEYDGIVYFDGVIPMGYNDALPPFPKQGIYRSQAPGVTTVEFRNASLVKQ